MKTLKKLTRKERNLKMEENNSKNNLSETVRWAYWGGPDISVYFLEECKNIGFLPHLIITTPDRKVGRKQILTETPLAIFANENKIKVLKPESLKENEDLKSELKNIDLSFVTAYGKIIPKDLLDLPKYKTLNFHPSLLPKYRGPSPIMSALLDDTKNTGVSIMQLDEKMDHGPVLIQEKMIIDEWIKNDELEKGFAYFGASIFTAIFDQYIYGKLELKEQDHEQATFCEKFEKKDMELLGSDDDYLKYRKYCAFPKPFFFEDEKRYVVTQATYTENKFVIEKVIPEGKKERDWVN